MRSRRYDERLRALPADVLHEFLLRISRIDRFRGWWEGRDRLPAALLARLRKNGVETSAGVTFHPAASAGRSFGRQAGYAALLRTVFDGYREMTFEEERIRQFHADLLRYSPSDRAHRGNYRSLPGGFAPPAGLRPESPALRPADPARTAEEMADLTAWTAENLESGPYHPLFVIPSFLLEFLAIRPFVSGNGRTSRILANYLLLRCGYAYVPYRSLERIIADRRIEYLIALRRSQAFRNLPRPDISAWIRIFLEVLEAQADGLERLVSGFPSLDRLSANQRAVLELLDTHREVTNRLVVRELGIPRDTAKQVLGRLQERSLVQRTGEGRAARYRRTPLPPGSGIPQPGPAR